MKNNSFILMGLAGLLFCLSSCTKLDEASLITDRVDGSLFGSTAAELSSLVIAAYSPFTDAGGFNSSLVGGDAGGYMPLTEVTSDELSVPGRGNGDWDDAGKWVKLKTHTYQKDHPYVTSAWNGLYKGVATCNRLLAALAQIQNNPAVPQYIAELKVLRAYYYYCLLDLYGNVPLSIDFAQTDPPPTEKAAKVYAFIEKELLENTGLLPRTGSKDRVTYGRMNCYTGFAILAKLYLNAETYTGKPEWQKALNVCDTIINSGKYTLNLNYFDNFSRNNNTTTSENIWAIPFDAVKTPGNHIQQATLHFANQNTYSMTAQPWNGFSATTEFYNSYIDPLQNPGPQGSVVGLDKLGTKITGTADKRLGNFVVGPQYNADGTRAMDNTPGTLDPDGPPVTLTPYIDDDYTATSRQAGARIGKYQLYPGMTASIDNDMPIFRYADILLMKAEAAARLTGNWSNATTSAIVNNVREVHGGVYPLILVTKENFLAERGREMFYEGWRRQDMIRFGTYNKAFKHHPADASTHVNIFPIPVSQINANGKLVQNPGYN